MATMNRILHRISKRYSVEKIQQIQDLNHSSLKIELSKTRKPIPPNKELIFGRVFSDHMLEVDWEENYGWSAPSIRPFGSLNISPAANCLHYALEAFEGLKAYRDDNDDIRLFRPQLNIDRLLRSSKALCLPAFNSNEFMKCLYDLLKVDKHWIPAQYPYSLYIRPTIIGTSPFIGVAPAKHAKLYAILSPVGPYYPEGFNPVALLATDKYIRAWPRGSGSYKLGANYGPSIHAQQEAAEKGYAQVMWLFHNPKDDEDYITEVGTMNQFIFWKNEEGVEELVTPPLDGTILPGVTRDSILALTREWNEFQVTERPITMKELIKASQENRILEAFGAGTAAIVSPVKLIGYKDIKLNIPLDINDPNEKAGPLARRLFQSIIDIQYGRVFHPWSVVVPK